MKWSATIRSRLLARIAWPHPSTLLCTHSFPFAHVDHLHPDWAIALAASANGKRKLDEFNKEFDRKIVWLPWQRPGFELALMIERAVKDNPGAEGLILGGHGLFTWGTTQRDCYLNSIHTIDQMGEFILKHQSKKGSLFGGVEHASGAEIARTLRPRFCPRCGE